jgi:hypothetical protein
MSAKRAQNSGHRLSGTGRNVRKSELPSKPCAACARPFMWRKKWARDWENVKYCSRACADARGRRAD